MTFTAYKSPFRPANGHLETILPHYFRRVPEPAYVRERLTTPDQDFLDLDWVIGTRPQAPLLILSHGLEGSSRSKYIRGMVRRFSAAGFDTLSWNHRSCGGEINRLPIFYHSGASYDLQSVVEHVLRTRAYQEIYLCGFSLGGNVTLKYLGEQGAGVNPRLRRAVVFSVPCDLRSSALRLKKGLGRFYTRHLLRPLNAKFQAKRTLLEPLGFDLRMAHKISDFKTWDDAFTAPLHGFRDAEEYWARSSSRPLLPKIAVPTLILNAQNDPFLGEDCFPYEQLKDHDFVSMPELKAGGHVGFLKSSPSGGYWSEDVALAFIAGN